MSAPPWYAAPRCRFAQRLTAQRELHGQGDARDPDSSPLPPNARATARGHATPFGHGGAGTECGMGETSAEPATDSDGAMRPAISSNASNLQEGCRGDRSWARTTKEAPHYDNTTGLSRSGDRVPSAVRRRQWRRSASAGALDRGGWHRVDGAAEEHRWAERGWTQRPNKAGCYGSRLESAKARTKGSAQSPTTTRAPAMVRVLIAAHRPSTGIGSRWVSKYAGARTRT